jgi:hypothetical protein
MDEIFKWFNLFSDEFNFREIPIEYKYYFPEVDNLGISRTVSHNICLYVSILFIRQFTLPKIYVYQNFTIFHNLTSDLQDLYSYNYRLPYFRNCIDKVLSNDRVLEVLGYKVDRELIFKTFDELSERIKEKINLKKLEAELSNEKVSLFEKTTNYLIEVALDGYEKINNKESFAEVDESVLTSISGERITASKSAFTEIETPVVNFDSVYPNYIVEDKIQFFIPNSFVLAKTSQYLIEREQLIKGLEKILSDDSNKIIVGVSLGYDSKQRLEGSIFKESLIEIKSSNYLLRDTFFILDRTDLPIIEPQELTKNEIEKFELKPLNDKYKLYSNVVDVNLKKYEKLKYEYGTSSEDELKVLVIIAFTLLIKWKKNRKIVMLELTSPFLERGMADRVEDLKSFSDI